MRASCGRRSPEAPSSSDIHQSVFLIEHLCQLRYRRGCGRRSKSMHAMQGRFVLREGVPDTALEDGRAQGCVPKVGELRQVCGEFRRWAWARTAAQWVFL